MEKKNYLSSQGLAIRLDIHGAFSSLFLQTFHINQHKNMKDDF